MFFFHSAPQNQTLSTGIRKWHTQENELWPHIFHCDHNATPNDPSWGRSFRINVYCVAALLGGTHTSCISFSEAKYIGAARKIGIHFCRPSHNFVRRVSSGKDPNSWRALTLKIYVVLDVPARKLSLTETTSDNQIWQLAVKCLQVCALSGECGSKWKTISAEVIRRCFRKAMQNTTPCSHQEAKCECKFHTKSMQGTSLRCFREGCWICERFLDIRSMQPFLNDREHAQISRHRLTELCWEVPSTKAQKHLMNRPFAETDTFWCGRRTFDLSHTEQFHHELQQRVHRASGLRACLAWKYSYVTPVAHGRCIVCDSVTHFYVCREQIFHHTCFEMKQFQALMQELCSKTSSCCAKYVHIWLQQSFVHLKVTR